MGTVGINFGSATSGTGFDVTTTVSNIVAKLKSIETPWNNQLTSLKDQDTAFTSIGTDLSALSSSLQALTDFQGVMASKLGSSSDPNILSLSSAGPTAVAGSHTVVVSQLAQTSSQYTGAMPVSDLLSGALTITVGSGSPHVIPVVSGASDTLATYSAAINAADVGVSASVISDSAGSRLSLVSKTSGLAGQLTVTSGGTVTTTTCNGVRTPAVTYGALNDITASTDGMAIGFNVGLDGQNAKLTVDNRAVDSASNIISTAIPGVSFQLLSYDPTTTIQVQVANDNSSIETAFSSLVSTYNKVVGDISAQEGNDSSGNAEPLFGNTVLSQIQSSLSLALTSGAASGNVSSLYQLGISINQDGTLKLDTSTLDSKLNSNYSDVVAYLQNTGGFGQNLATTLNQIGSTNPTGAITLALSANSSQESALTDDISAQDALIATQQANLTSELNTANEVLQAIPQQLDEINELYSAMTGYNTGNS
jgi:flagellar hook-associated protein 2